MTPDVVRRLILVHGIVAWLDAFLLLAVAILLLRERWPERWPDKPWFYLLSVAATLGAIASFASGLSLDLHYRVHVRQRLFVASKSLGWLFERKMHLSFGVFLFATIGLFTLFLVRKDPRFFRSVRASFVLAALLAVFACVISSVVKIYTPSIQ